MSHHARSHNESDELVQRDALSRDAQISAIARIQRHADAGRESGAAHRPLVVVLRDPQREAVISGLEDQGTHDLMTVGDRMIVVVKGPLRTQLRPVVRSHLTVALLSVPIGVSRVAFEEGRVSAPLVVHRRMAETGQIGSSVDNAISTRTPTTCIGQSRHLTSSTVQTRRREAAIVGDLHAQADLDVRLTADHSDVPAGHK